MLEYFASFQALSETALVTNSSLCVKFGPFPCEYLIEFTYMYSNLRAFCFLYYISALLNMFFICTELRVIIISPPYLSLNIQIVYHVYNYLLNCIKHLLFQIMVYITEARYTKKIPVPVDKDNLLPLQMLERYFPGAVGLMYFGEDGTEEIAIS